MEKRVKKWYNNIKGEMLKMLHKNDENRVNQVQMVSIDSLVPKNHLLRKIDETIDFSFIYDLIED